MQVPSDACAAGPDARLDFETLHLDLSDHALTLTLNRPDKLNAFNATMMGELIRVFDAAEALGRWPGVPGAAG